MTAVETVERAQVVNSLERRVRELDVLSQVSQAVNFTANFDDLLELISTQTDKLIEASHFYIVLREAGADELDQWYSDFVGTDWKYVERYYETDTLPPWHECVVQGEPLIERLPIPPLAQRPVEVRFAF